MKDKILTAVSAVMVLVPWTIFPLRQNDWALESPTAEIMIVSYAVFMIASGIFSILAYKKGNVQNNVMKVTMMINSIYAVAAVALLGIMAFQNLG
ncbi:MAG: hypothetical protein KH282_06380 [Clostridiales bacterium]|nr:hypothetical protein [Clostridiales bacterium]